ncbi:Pentatricopeptide repeat superfamily protein [Perilla frutescens var. hirtella]|uniref:Pentatricopeptide repeat superfamily protein n=1 Tax=Perilla frutescens var. hirtella TaxID=608512 RepID=A0AAD4NYB2_PERFH|nr:Pentatricopeptide repeat superfamily protein [Perilla frutescens var. hirtella]
MASLHKLLSEEGFERHNSRKPTKKVKFRDRKKHQESIALPIYICHDRRSFDSSKQRADKACSVTGSSVISSRRAGSGSERTDVKSVATERERARSRDEPAIDDVAVKAMVAILSGYVGQYLKDEAFRLNTREKCRSCFERRRRRRKASDGEIFSHMEMGIQSIERLVENSEMKREMDLESLQKCIKILNVVATLDSTNDSSCRKTNSHLSACANLYLSITYKIARNDRISARNLLQVFCDAPFLARTHLLPELWEHFFLPHLLHLKIWYSNELDSIERLDDSEKEKKIKGLNKQYREQMDKGTIQFALYYKEWLKVGAQAPSIPTVPLPLPSKSTRSRRKSSESSTSHHSSSSKLLYQAVFGTNMKRQSMEFDQRKGASRNVWDFEMEEREYGAEDVKHCNYVEKKAVVQRGSYSQSYELQKAELWPDSQKSDYFRFLGCRTEPAECLTQLNYVPNNEKNNVGFQLSDMARAIATICSSGSLSECEAAIRAVSEAWLNSHNPQLEASLSRASVMQGILEVLYVSSDDEILELAVSILAEIATKNEANRQCILASDPQLVVSMRLLRSSSLFLKAAVLLYLVKPKAKQMVSMEWIPLVLRVLEFGDQLQTLFTVRCSPHEAAYYFLNQLVTGFDEDKNLENAKQIISLGGLGLLVRRMDIGDASEKSRAASILRHCIRADGSCRHYLVKNLKKDAILSLLVFENQANSQGHALALLSELLCVSRRNKRIEFLTRLKEGWNCLNTLHILLLRLQRARAEERPIIAVILLKLDLMGDVSECSVYRDEAIDALVQALDCWVFDEKIQQQAARALLILGGHFSYTGEQEIEKWLLRKAELFSYNSSMNEDEKMNENWQRKAALVLLTSGSRRLLSALSDSLANSIPSLARASLVTICWISSFLHSVGDRDLYVAACSILAPHLIECLIDSSNNLEEKILASFSLHSLTNGTDYFLQQSRVDKEFILPQPPTKFLRAPPPSATFRPPAFQSHSNPVLRGQHLWRRLEVDTPFVLMLVREVLLDEYSFSLVLKSCSRLSLLSRGMQIHGLILKLGMPRKDSFSYNLMIDGYVKCGMVSLTRELFDIMPSEMKNLVSWNTMISGYLTKLENGFESAKDLFDKNNMTTNSTEALATCLK